MAETRPSRAPAPPAGPIPGPAAIEAIARGEHGDPFAVLGPHAVNLEGKPAVVVRTFLPEADRACSPAD